MPPSCDVTALVIINQRNIKGLQIQSGVVTIALRLFRKTVSICGRKGLGAGAISQTAIALAPLLNFELSSSS